MLECLVVTGVNGLKTHVNRHFMNEKSTTISLRISAELKRKLEASAGNQNLTLTEYLREVISDTQGEKVLSLARQEVASLEAKAVRLEADVSRAMELFAIRLSSSRLEQEGLLRDLETARAVIKSERPKIYPWAAGLSFAIAVITVVAWKLIELWL